MYRAAQMDITLYLAIAKLAATISGLPSQNPITFIGDFNVNILDFSPSTALRLSYCDEAHHLRQLMGFMWGRKCSQALAGPTVDSGLQIDHVWTDACSRLAHMQPRMFRLEVPCSDLRAVGMALQHIGLQ